MVLLDLHMGTVSQGIVLLTRDNETFLFVWKKGATIPESVG